MRVEASLPGSDHATALRGAAARPGVVAIVTLTLATAAGAYAAPALGQAAVPCTAIENDSQRLACYDRALRGTPATPAPATRAATPATAAPPTAPAAPRREREIRESAARPAPAPQAAPAAPVAGRNDDGEQIVPIVIVSMRGLPGRETTFTTDDGTRWVQTDSQRLAGLPDAPFNAELKRGAMGSYFLVPKERGRAIRVRPAER